MVLGELGVRGRRFVPVAESLHLLAVGPDEARPSGNRLSRARLARNRVDH
jgi:hypothetical protein